MSQLLNAGTWVISKATEICLQICKYSRMVSCHHNDNLIFMSSFMSCASVTLVWFVLEAIHTGSSYIYTCNNPVFLNK